LIAGTERGAAVTAVVLLLVEFFFPFREPSSSKRKKKHVIDAFIVATVFSGFESRLCQRFKSTHVSRQKTRPCASPRRASWRDAEIEKASFSTSEKEEKRTRKKKVEGSQWEVASEKEKEKNAKKKKRRERGRTAPSPLPSSKPLALPLSPLDRLAKTQQRYDRDKRDAN